MRMVHPIYLGYGTITLRDIDAFGDEEHKNEPVDYEDDKLW